MSSREQRQELARCAPDLPEQLPPATKGRPIPLSREVEPHCDALFSEDTDFRAAAASVNSEGSPAGRLCFDDSDMAEMVRAHAKDNGGNPRIINAVRGVLSTAVKRCMTRRGVGRMQRIREAKNRLLTGGAPSAQPAE
jgi:hypothetical protein